MCIRVNPINSIKNNVPKTRKKVFHIPDEYVILYGGHSGDFGNAAKMVGKMSKSVMQLISIGF